MSVLCPAIKVRITVGSKILDDLKLFTGFVMRSLYEGYSVADIDAVIGLGQAVVTEEIDYLRNIGFISGEDNTFSVSGKEFCTLMTTVDNTNEREINAYVELFSGKILPYIPDIFTDSVDENETKVLKSSVYTSSLYERDYGETTKFIFDSHNDLFEGLTSKQLESIYTQLEFDRSSEGFILLKIDNVPALDNIFEIAPKDCIKLKRSFIHIRWSAASKSLDSYLNVLDSLESLANIEDGVLVSPFGHRLLEFRREEREFNATLKPLIYDNFLREFVDSIPDTGDAESDIEAPRQIDTSAKRWTISCMDYFKYHIEQSIIPNLSAESLLRVAAVTCDNSYYVQSIPFDLFLEKLYKPTQDESED